MNRPGHTGQTTCCHASPGAFPHAACRPSRALRRSWVGVLCVAIAGCVQLPAPVVEQRVEPTAKAFEPGVDTANSVWHGAHVRFKTPTQYATSSVAGVPCIRATANAAWSFWIAPVPAAFAQASTLSWRWHIPALIDGADLAAIGKDDAPARMLIAFKGDRSKLDAAERATMSLAKALGGLELPYAALQYSIDHKAAPDSLLPNANTTRIKKIIVQSGTGGLNQWQSFERDVRADFRRAFPGEEPGEIESVGLMTDTDSLGGVAEACYADVRLR